MEIPNFNDFCGGLLHLRVWKGSCPGFLVMLLKTNALSHLQLSIFMKLSISTGFYSRVTNSLIFPHYRLILEPFGSFGTIYSSPPLSARMEHWLEATLQYASSRSGSIQGLVLTKHFILLRSAIWHATCLEEFFHKVYIFVSRYKSLYRPKTCSVNSTMLVEVGCMAHLSCTDQRRELYPFLYPSPSSFKVIYSQSSLRPMIQWNLE